MPALPFERHAWHSTNAGRQMPVERWGRAGAPVLYCPSSGGDSREFERYGMVEIAAPWIERGAAQFFSIDGMGPATLWNDGIAPPARMQGYVRFERYVRDELLPWLRAATGRDDLTIVGSSYGAYVAANLWLKRPGEVRLAGGFGGVYGLWHRLDGHHDGDVYFHTPLEFLPRLDDASILAAIRATRGFALYGGAQDHWLPSTLAMADALRDKGLPHHLEVWAERADHHEHWWKRQLRQFLERYLGG